MRWLIDARPLVDPAQGGVSRVARGLLSAFGELAKNDEIILATTGQKQSLTTHYPLPPTHYQHIHLRLPNKLWSAATCAGITSLDQEIEQRAGKIDGIFLPNLGFVGKLNRPYVLLLHDLSFLIEPRWFSHKMRLWHTAVRAEKLIRGASALLSVSETTKRDAVKLLGIPENKITVIPIGPTITGVLRLPAGKAGPVSYVRQLPTTNYNLPTRYVLALGGNDSRKNAQTAVQAVKILKQEKGFEDLELILIGSDNRVSDEKLSELYQNASAFLYPSWYEGYGLPLHEAAAHGTPCIASTAGALPETAPRGTLFADPAKPQHWATALKIVLTSSSNYVRAIHELPLPTTCLAGRQAHYPPRVDERTRVEAGPLPPNNWPPAAEILFRALQTASCSGNSFCST